MDTVKYLLGAACALLLVAVVASWQNMAKGVRETPAEEMDRFRKQLAELRAEQDKLKLEKQRIEWMASAKPAAPEATPNTAEIEALRRQWEEERKQQAELENRKNDPKLAMEEEGLVHQKNLENNDRELRRARLIAEALLVGKIREYVEDADIGSFITFDIMAPQEVSIDPGTIVAIRRKTGILSQFKVAEVSPEGGIANPLPGFGEVKPQIGDELILPPPL